MQQPTPGPCGPDRAACRPPAPSATTTPTATPITRTPLVVALHPTSPHLDLSASQVASLRTGAVTDRSDLDARPGALTVGPPAQVRVDPLRDLSAYAVTTEGPAAPRGHHRQGD